MPSKPRPLIIPNLLPCPTDPSLRWEPFRTGIEIARLCVRPGGPTVALLRYAPGASLDRHHHVGYEHIFVLQGSQTDDCGEHLAGTLLIHPPGTSHAITSHGGCIVLAIWEKPVVFAAPAAEVERLPG